MSRDASAIKACVYVSLVVAAGCSSLGEYEAGPAVHVVRRGETLYQIAWQHGVDQRDLVRWNGIRNPDVIYVGQQLRLYPPAPRGTQSATPTQAARPARGAPPQTARPAPLPSSASSSAAAPRLPPPAWEWPSEGPVVSRFGAASGIGTGIAIGGRLGQTVRAAADGRVVYAGSGLIGYGQLVIIKHNDTYLSAYGYNSELRVVQGQDVRRGQEIAAMGLGPERQARLHFEIRANGVPVDPVPLLAARR